MDNDIETARLLAKFKLQVRRNLNESVDLQLLANDAQYAQSRLAEIEDKANDEDLLVTLLQLRARLLPQPAPKPSPAPVKQEADLPSAPGAALAGETRQYKFGARSW